jgi:hypothetical protein
MTTKKLRTIRLSRHFKANEIFYSTGIGEPTISNRPKIQRVQLYLARTLCNNLLEPIREVANTLKNDSVISVLGGCRNTKSHEHMKKYNWTKPSETSDHSYINDYYALGVGAADFVVPHFTAGEMRWLFEEAIKIFDGKQYGQIIFYPTSPSKFIHISNPKAILGNAGKQIQIVEPKKRMIFTGDDYMTFKK